MKCPRCGTSNSGNLTECVRCGGKLESLSEANTFAGVSLPPLPPGVNPTPAPPRVAAPASVASNMPTAGPWAFGMAPAPEVDQVNFGPRYRIERMLGEGGMGAVYLAYDKELDRPVALKLIRPGLAMDSNAAMRFKQELLLASKVSHKNILRIHDLGDAAGVKFISMAYVEGQDLHQLLEKEGRLPIERALKIAKQLCAALEAAHTEGVVHRDFKPQNILLDKNDVVYVSDFGLAKSLEHDSGMTRSGECLGTPRYMAPEQASGSHIDHRVDVYALGLILYEMVTGDVPFHAETPFQLMFKRVQELPASPKTLNPELPDWLTGVIMKCLERDPAQRYHSATDILRDLESAAAPPRAGKTTESRQFTFALPVLSRVAWTGIAVALLVVAAVTTFFVRVKLKSSSPAGSPKSVTVLVADFTNHTGDPVFENTLEPMFNVALEGASFINAFNRGEARRVAAKLPNPSNKLDEQTARLVAANQGVNVVVSGTLQSQGTGYELLLKAVRSVTGETVANTQVEAANKDQVLFAATKAAAAIRQALGDNTSESDQLFAMETITATSIEAVHDYSEGMEALTRGKNDDAMQSFSKAVDLDQNFGLAYAGKAIAARNSGTDEDAVPYIKQAISHIDRMTERERYRSRAIFYMLTHNYQKCVEEFGALVSRYPSDAAAHNNMGICWSRLRDMPKAMGEMRRVTEILPKGIPYRVNLAFYEALAGDLQNSEREVKDALAIEPNFAKAYLVLGYAQMGNGEVQDAAETFHKLEKLSPVAASIAAAGLADIAVYEGRFGDAVRILEDAAAVDLKAKRLDRAADKFAALAYAELLRDRKEPAQAAANNALANYKSVKIRFIAGDVFAKTGVIGKAREIAASLGSELAAEPQAYAKLIEGEIAMQRGNAHDGVKAFSDANNFLDTWLGHFDLGRAYLEAGAFTEADSEFDRCAKRRGEALLLFMDDVPTYGYFPAVYYYQGRVRQGLKTSDFSESYRKYLSIRAKPGEDPLLAEVRRRAGQ